MNSQQEIITELVSIHAPVMFYDICISGGFQCPHQHVEDTEICLGNPQHYVCRTCCMDSGGLLNEKCENQHQHGDVDEHMCDTAALLSDLQTVLFGVSDTVDGAA